MIVATVRAFFKAASVATVVAAVIALAIGPFFALVAASIAGHLNFVLAFVAGVIWWVGFSFALVACMEALARRGHEWAGFIMCLHLGPPSPPNPPEEGR